MRDPVPRVVRRRTGLGSNFQPGEAATREHENKPRAFHCRTVELLTSYVAFKSTKLGLLVSLKTKMKKHRAPGGAIVLALVAVVAAAASRLRAAEPPASTSVSPDKKWEYRCDPFGSGQCAPEIIDTATKEVALDLMDLPSGNYADEARVVWSPDSQRVAFNHSPPHASHTTYKTTVIYQLRDNKWVSLESPVDRSDRSQLLQLTRKYSPKSSRDLSVKSPVDTLTVRKWTDANTAILYASNDETAALFTLKFNAKGKGKIVAMHRMSKAEMEKDNADE